MSTEPTRVSFDQDGQRLEGEVLSPQLSSTKLLKIRVDGTGVTVVRHADRVAPLNICGRECDARPIKKGGGR